jgi:GNAT superfamily N-acetyltransferase
MLLPESFEAVAPEALVAWDEAARAIAGVAAFHRVGRETVRTSVITVRPYRRQGIGSSLLRRVVERAIERADESVHGQVDLIAHPEAHVFLTANGFHRGTVRREMEGDLEAMRGPLLDLHARLAASGSIPASARIADNRDFSPRELERVYRDLLVGVLGSPPELAGPVVRTASFSAVIVMVADEPAGIMVCIYNDGSGTGTTRAMAVAPRFRGWGWVSLLLQLGAMERAWAAGARRLRFGIDESNSSIMSLTARLNPVVLRRHAQYVLRLDPSGAAPLD